LSLLKFLEAIVQLLKKHQLLAFSSLLLFWAEFLHLQFQLWAKKIIGML